METNETELELIVFDKAIHDPVIADMLTNHVTRAMSKIVRFGEQYSVTYDSIPEYVVTVLANTDNILAQRAKLGKYIGEDLRGLACMDLVQLFSKLETAMGISYTPSEFYTGFSTEYAKSIEKLTSLVSDDVIIRENPEMLLNALIDHYGKCGCGTLSKYNAFKYEGTLSGIEKTDNITFDDLVGLEYQKRMLTSNTRALLDGKQANNVLLFGDRGSGKSSSVKALLNMYADEGLRVIEMPKEYISDIPKLTDELERSNHKYIIFLDDLSFESHEKDYRALKIAMDGQLRSNPQNVVIYATSNRRHLIKETWADREGGEIHRNDNMQETLSLAERFGISLVFSAPTSQKEYLNIVSELLAQHNVEMTDEIGKEAVVWQMNYGSRSGRCAKQFVASYISREK